MLDRKLKFGMVGGAVNSFIGNVHVRAAQLDGYAELAAGCFSRDGEINRKTAEKYYLNKERVYKTYAEMAQAEANRGDGIDFAIIATPNNSHYEIAKAFLQQGIHVVCDKPLSNKVEEALELRDLAKERSLLLGVTYTNAGYPIIKQAKHMVENGEIGKIISVHCEYLQGHMLNRPISSKKGWRTNPDIGGKGCCIADIGVHVENLVSYITGLDIEAVCADLEAVRPDMVLDTSAQIMIKYKGGASGFYWCSQVAAGFRNDLKIRIMGDRKSIEWSNMDPENLIVRTQDEPKQVYSAGQGYLYPEVKKITRISSGHPEGFYEAMAEIYRSFELTLASKITSQDLEESSIYYPDTNDGIKGVLFIEKCVESSNKGVTWIKYC